VGVVTKLCLNFLNQHMLYVRCLCCCIVGSCRVDPPRLPRLDKLADNIEIDLPSTGIRVWQVYSEHQDIQPISRVQHVSSWTPGSNVQGKPKVMRKQQTQNIEKKLKPSLKSLKSGSKIFEEIVFDHHFFPDEVKNITVITIFLFYDYTCVEMANTAHTGLS
jgi:hypothetical protein